MPSIRARLGQLVDDGVRTVIVDLGNVRFLDSAGIAVLINGRRLMNNARGVLYIRNARARVAQVLDLTGVAETLALPPDYATAEK